MSMPYPSALFPEMFIVLLPEPGFKLMISLLLSTKVKFLIGLPSLRYWGKHVL